MEIILLDDRINLPEYATTGSAAFDLRACNADGETMLEHILIAPGETVKIGCGIALDLGSYDCEEVNGGEVSLSAMVLPRSGLGCKGLKPSNSPGLIDSDYHGEIIVCLVNQGHKVARIDALDRIAQLMIVPAFKPEFEVVEAFARETERGDGGFGHTGSK